MKHVVNQGCSCRDILKKNESLKQHTHKNEERREVLESTSKDCSAVS